MAFCMTDRRIVLGPALDSALTSAINLLISDRHTESLCRYLEDVIPNECIKGVVLYGGYARACNGYTGCDIDVLVLTSRTTGGAFGPCGPVELDLHMADYSRLVGDLEEGRAYCDGVVLFDSEEGRVAAWLDNARHAREQRDWRDSRELIRLHARARRHILRAYRDSSLKNRAFQAASAFALLPSLFALQRGQAPDSLSRTADLGLDDTLTESEQVALEQAVELLRTLSAVRLAKIADHEGWELL